MKCPQCHNHVTPLGAWARQFVDDPKKCPSCGTRLLPSRRATWGCLLFVMPMLGLMLGLLVVVLVASISDGPNIVTRFFDWVGGVFGPGKAAQQIVGVVAKIIAIPFVIAGTYGLFYLVWRTGVYRIDTRTRKRSRESDVSVPSDKQTCPLCGGMSPARSPSCYQCGHPFTTD